MTCCFEPDDCCRGVIETKVYQLKMPRNRLKELGDLNEGYAPPSYAAEEDDEDGVYIDEPDNGENFMGAFFEEVNTIRNAILKIQQNVDIVEHKHQDLLVAYSHEQTSQANKVLEEHMSLITTLANNVRMKLKKMDQENKQAESSSTTGLSADIRIRQSQHSTLSRKFVQVMTQYNDIQAANKRKYREAFERQCRIVDPEIESSVVDSLLERGETAEIFKGKRLEEAEQALNDIQERHEDILRLERSLKELHDMFVDMSILVSEQGDMIDRIENSVAKSTDYVESARRKVKRAEELQKAARRKKWCCLFLIIIGILVIVGIVMGIIGGGN